MILNGNSATICEKPSAIKANRFDRENVDSRTALNKTKARTFTLQNKSFKMSEKQMLADRYSALISEISATNQRLQLSWWLNNLDVVSLKSGNGT